jgi:hypothetical protein
MTLTVAIVTKDRTVLMRRALRSYLAHAHAHEREVRFLVVDGTEDLATRNENKRVAREASHEYRTAVWYFSAREEETTAKLLRQKGVDPEEVDAALGSEKGALRNAAILAACGDPVVCVDDATCAKSTGSSNANPVLFRSGDLRDPTGVTPFESRALSLLDSSFRSEDLLGSMTRFLGREAGDIRTRESWKGRHPTKGRVCVVQAGTVGGSTFEWDAYPLVYRGGTAAGLKSEASYARAVAGKGFLRSVKCPEIGTWTFALPHVVALDTSGPLPPFLPVGKPPPLLGGGDVFGALLRLLVPSSLVGFIPSAVYYDPPSKEGAGISTPPVVFQDLVVRELGNVQSLAELGVRLRALASSGDEDLVQKMKEGAANRRVALKADVQGLLAHSRGSSTWRADMEALLAACETNGEYLPSDLGGSEGEVVAESKILLDRCGRTLVGWPTLLKKSRELRASGKELAITL